MLYIFKNIRNRIIIITCIICCGGNTFAGTQISNINEPTPYFVGREEFLDKIQSDFTHNKKIVTLIGIAGIGKSQIAKEFAKKYRNRYKIIWFLDGKRDLSSQFQNLAQQINRNMCNNISKCNLDLDLSKVIDSVIVYLSNLEGWLLVLDDFPDDSQIPLIENFLNHNALKNQHLLITSRKKGNLPNAITISPFKREESIILLEKILKSDRKDLSKLALALRDYPLGVHRSAVFLSNTPYVSLDDYILMINNSINELDKLAEKDAYITEQSVLQLVKSYLERFNEKTKQTLVYCALLDNKNIYKELIYDIDNKPNHPISRNEFIKSLLELSNYSLIEYKQMKNNTNAIKVEQADLEMHDLLKQCVEEVLPNKELKEYTQNLAIKLNTLLAAHLREDLLNKYPLILSNLNELANNAEKYQIDKKVLFELKANLLNMYLYELNYARTKELLDWFDEKVKSSFIEDTKDIPETKKAVAEYLQARGWYYDNINDEYEEGIKNYKQAITLITPLEDIYYELLCELHITLAQTEVNAGYLRKAAEDIKKVELLLDKHQNISLPIRGFYYFVNALIEMYKGNNHNALEIISKGEEIKKKLAYEFQASAATFLLKAEILLRLGKIEQGYQIARALYEKSLSHFEGDHEMQARIIIELAAAESEQGKLNMAEEHVDKAIKIVLKQFGADKKEDDLLKNDDLAFLYIVKGDIFYKKEYFKEALSYYEKALEIFNTRYRTIEIDLFSELYYKMAIAALKAGDMLTYKHFLLLQEKHYGIEHIRTKLLYEAIG